MQVLVTDGGMDPEGRLADELGPRFSVRFADAGRPLADQLPDTEVLVIRDETIDARFLDRAPRLKLIQRMGEHLGAVDVGAAEARGVAVARVPASPLSARTVAEQAFFLMMALFKRYGETRESVAAGRLGLPRTEGMQGKTLGIVGLGRSGSQLATMARGFGMKIVAIQRRPQPALARELGLEFLGGPDDRDRMLGLCDAISLHIPLRPATRHLIDAGAFAAMKEGARLVNVARAALVERAALEAALRSGRLAGAAFDVFWQEPAPADDPLLKLPNFLLTPHVAGFSREAVGALVAATAANIRLVADGKPPLHPVLPVD